MKALNIIKILAIHLHKELHKYTANHQSTTAMTHSLLNEKQEQCQRTTRLITKKLDEHECPKMNSLDTVSKSVSEMNQKRAGTCMPAPKFVI